MSVVLNIEYLGVNMMHQIFPFLEIKAVNRSSSGVSRFLDKKSLCNKNILNLFILI